MTNKTTSEILHEIKCNAPELELTTDKINEIMVEVENDTFNSASTLFLETLEKNGVGEMDTDPMSGASVYMFAIADSEYMIDVPNDDENFGLYIERND